MHSDFYFEEIKVFRHALSKRVHVLVKSSEAVEVHGGRAWRPRPTTKLWMPCSFCGNWCFFWSWTSVWKASGEADPAWWDWETNQADANLFWLRGCWPTCSANETWAELHEAEQEAYRAVTRLVRALHEALAETRWTWSYRDFA